MKTIATSAAVLLLLVANAGAQQSDQPAATLPAPAPTTAPPPQSAPADTQKIDTASFIERTMKADDFEVASSRLALDKSRNDALRAFAQRMIADHTASGERLGRILAEKAIAADATGAMNETGAVTDTSPDEEADRLDRLNAAEGEAFDELYIELQAEAHVEGMRLFTSYAESGDNAALRDFAVTTLPKLQEHQQSLAELGK